MLADTNSTSASSSWGQRAPKTVSQAMRQIYIHTPAYGGEDAGRAARVFRNQMINRIGDPAQPLYSIQTDIDVRLGASGITQENLATRYQAQASLNYKLFELDRSGKALPKQLATGNFTSWSGYDVVNSPFSDVVAEREAIDRVAGQLAEILYTRISSYFARPKQQFFRPL
ncbi:MAG: twin-arginine translocation pathway signal protein [Rhodospirillum sp.]|nr:twin-arginine translocation pathway signal protein [Rhodospirillum sp.]MCF8491625.1 twin-arginine translocation pathway signal protein [Rhodospirillum sp.]MCF8500134.1 twin-arginine translocation pathway signal protein [Rhodospirillum sp.]